MIKLGNVIFCKDGTRLVVIEMPNKEWGVLNLDTYQVRYVDMIPIYINEYHKGIATILDNINEL